MKINKEKYWVGDQCYKKSYPKSQIIIGNSLRADHNNIIHQLHKYHGMSKTWNTFTISRDGEIFQHYDFKNYSDYLGIGDVDKLSVSIVLENMGYLIEKENEDYVNLLNEVCIPENVVDKNFGGYTHWEKYDELQLDSLQVLCKHLCEELDIKRQCIEFNTYHKDIIKYNGITFRSNHFILQDEINPLFSIEEFSDKLSK